MRLTRRGQHGKAVLRITQNGLDHTVHQQIRIASDGAGEVCIGIKRQAKVAAVDRCIDRLLHGAQQHGVDLLCIRPILGGLGNRLELGRLRVVADRHTHGHGLEVVAQYVLFLGGGASVVSKSTAPRSRRASKSAR